MSQGPEVTDTTEHAEDEAGQTCSQDAGFPALLQRPDGNGTDHPSQGGEEAGPQHLCEQEGADRRPAPPTRNARTASDAMSTASATLIARGQLRSKPSDAVIASRTMATAIHAAPSGGGTQVIRPVTTTGTCGVRW